MNVMICNEWAHVWEDGRDSCNCGKRSGHTDPEDAIDSSTPMCHARHPESWGCTQIAGHTSPHKARGTRGGEVFMAWVDHQTVEAMTTTRTEADCNPHIPQREMSTTFHLTAAEIEATRNHRITPEARETMLKEYFALDLIPPVVWKSAAADPGDDPEDACVPDTRPMCESQNDKWCCTQAVGHLSPHRARCERNGPIKSEWGTPILTDCDPGDESDADVSLYDLRQQRRDK
jgi:hypothetical protein